MVKDSILPAVICSSDSTCITGLCAVIRHMLKLHLKDPNKSLCKDLLGFRLGCLMACAEVSIWTKFCEIDLLSSTKISLHEISNYQKCKLSEDIIRLENHMKQPLKIHNIHKRKNDPNRSEEEKTHCYAEGMDMMLSDVMIFVCLNLISKKIKSFWTKIQDIIPNVYRWYNKMENKSFIMKTIEDVVLHNEDITDLNVNVGDIKDTGSLYIRDVRRVKPKSSGEDYGKIIKKILDAGDCINVKENIYDEMFVDWNSLPIDAQLIGGDLPAKRLNRKCEQLDSMIREICSFAKPGDVIVDFCCGSGHLGIPIACLLPKCKVVLVENKESSISRARKRVKDLKLENVSIYQGNLDYFQGNFNIGVALHACGVATDLVLQRCIDVNASFVCCPCCYGSIENTHNTVYPRSERFKKNISYENYLLLSHVADQTDVRIAQAENGKLCMQLVDSDRLFLAEDNSYTVKLTRLNPPSCTPKNHIIIGIPLNI